MQKAAGRQFSVRSELGICSFHSILDVQCPMFDAHLSTQVSYKIQHGFFAAYKAYELGLAMEIQHMLISHTPRSWVLPQSIEAVILYNIDTADTEVLNQSLGIPHKPKA
jgi:hypothetical protein